MDMFDLELAYFIAHQDELVAKYPQKVIVLQGTEVRGACDTPLQAYLDASARFEPGTFMLQRCEPGSAAYTVTLSPGAMMPFVQENAHEGN